MVLLKILIVFCAILAYFILRAPRNLHPNVGLGALELLQKHGYQYEEHTVVTKDGYILDMQRIIPKKWDKSKKPILMMHGATGNSACWLNQGPDKSLAYMLSNLGYDIWLGNNRGNEFGKRHVTLDPYKNPAAFYNFSWDEIGRYDISAKIDYVLNATNNEQLIYVGYSSGATAFFVLMSEYPEYNDKVTFMSGLGPLAYMSNLPNPILNFFARYVDYMQWVGVLGVHEFPPRSTWVQAIVERLCHDDAITQPLCVQSIFMVDAYDHDQFNGTLVPVMIRNLPSGSSLKEFFHYGQGVNSGEFRQYDYGAKNLEVYGQTTPPSYDLSKITVPIVLHYGQNDGFSAAEDVEYFATKVSNITLYKIAYLKFSHLDFLWSDQVVELLFNDVIDVLIKNTN